MNSQFKEHKFIILIQTKKNYNNLKSIQEHNFPFKNLYFIKQKFIPEENLSRKEIWNNVVFKFICCRILNEKLIQNI